MRKNRKLIGNIGIIGIFCTLLMSCSIFRNSKRDTHISEIRQSSNVDYSLIDTSKEVELIRESLDVKLPKRSYGIDVPIINDSVHYFTNLYKLTLRLDKETNRLTGVFTLPDTLLHGDKTTLRIDQKGINEKRSEKSEKSEKDKKVVVENSVSWKTIVGAIVGLIIIILALWLWLKPKKII